MRPISFILQAQDLSDLTEEELFAGLKHCKEMAARFKKHARETSLSKEDTTRSGGSTARSLSDPNPGTLPLYPGHEYVQVRAP